MICLCKFLPLARCEKPINPGRCGVRERYLALSCPFRGESPVIRSRSVGRAVGRYEGCPRAEGDAHLRAEHR